jgi:hypothetical protein
MSFIRTIGWYGATLIALTVLTSGCTPLKTYLPLPDADGVDTRTPATDAAVDREGAGASDASSASDARDAGAAADRSGQSDAAPDPCLGKICNSPPAATCFDATTQRRFDATGSCVDGTCTYQSQDTHCAFGCTAGACKVDPCIGVTCNQPMPNICEDATHLRAYNTIGTCAAGSCSYASQVIGCTCVNASCAVDPCANITCASPPGPVCATASTLRTFAAAGTCTNGSCSYAPTDTACAFGCANGACQADPCAGVVCNSPPATFCVDGDTLRRYASSGTCSQGLCSYGSTDTVCADGCSGARCIIILPPPCFPAGTLITMADLSSMPIEAVRVGDQVLAYDPATGRSSPERVLRTFVHPYLAGSTLIRVNDQLAATPEHPFFRNGAWSPAGEIGLGDRLVRMEIGARGGPAFLQAPVTSVQREVIRSEIPVYNLEIEELHDYFAGGVLVHNKPVQP